MATFETRELSGQLFKNSKREEGSSQPNARGECRINGELWEISAWTKDTKNGGKWQSLSFKKKEERSGND